MKQVIKIKEIEFTIEASVSQNRDLADGQTTITYSATAENYSFHYTHRINIARPRPTVKLEIETFYGNMLRAIYKEVEKKENIIILTLQELGFDT